MAKQKTPPASPLPDKAASKPQPSPPPAHTTPLWQPLLLMAVAFFIHLNALNGDFIWDDGRQVLQNPYLRDTRYVGKIFTTDVWSFRGLGQRSNYYRPMMHLSYMATYQMFGLKPSGFHAINALFHAANTALVYVLLLLLFRSHWLALLSGLLFATHPIHTEAVIWIASQPEVCVTFFYLAAFILYIYPQVRNRPPSLYRGLSLLAFFIALLSKEMAITLPLTLLAYEVFYRRTPLVRAAPPIMLYGLPAGIYIAMRLQALGGFAAGDTHPEVQGLAYVWSTLVLIAKYGWKLLVPVPLNFFHLFAPSQSPIEPAVLGALAFLAVAGGGAWRMRAAHPAFSFGLLWIFLTLLPVLGIKQVGENVFTERYLYLPSIGFCWAVVYGIMGLGKRIAPAEQRKPATITLALVGGLAIFYSIITWVRAEDYRNEVTLFTRTLAQSPGAVPIRNGLGMDYFNQRQYDLAEREFKEALRYKPESPEAHMNLGVGYYIKGRNDDAIQQYREALHYRPSYSEAHYNLGLAYLKNRNLKGAIEEFEQALQSNPEYVKAYISLGAARRSEGKTAQAVDAHQRALALKPDMVEAHVNLGLDYMALRRFEQAATSFSNALRIDPGYAEGYNFLGLAYVQQGRRDDAIQQYREALRLKPNLAEARANLDQALAFKGP